VHTVLVVEQCIADDDGIEFPPELVGSLIGCTGRKGINITNAIDNPNNREKNPIIIL
jgi:hypothetical protein